MKLSPTTHPLNQTLSELSDWFRDPLVDFEPFSRWFGTQFGEPATPEVARLRTDVFETDADYVVRFHVPGATKDALKVQLDPDATLTVRQEGKPAEDSDNGGSTPLVLGVRKLTLPKDTDTDAIAATFEAGVLTVKVSKRAESKPRNIEVR